MHDTNCYCEDCAAIRHQAFIDKVRNPIHDGSDAWPCCECDNCKAWRRSDANKVPMSFVQMSGNIETGEVIEPLHKRSGVLDLGTMTMTSERDSIEADAAQALFVEYGVPVGSLIANVGYGTSLTVALRKMRAVIPNIPHDGKDYVLACECPGCCQFREHAKAIGCTPLELAQEMAKFPADHFKLPTSTIGKSLKPSAMPMRGSCSGDAVLSAREMTKQLQERGFLVRANVGSQPRVADITGFAAGRRYECDIERPSVGGGKTAAMVGAEIHQAMDASQRNEKLKQELIRQYTNTAAFKLGRYVGDDKPIKDQLAQNLVLIGCSYTEAGEIISELVEALRNE
jgi:hypothetical protein